MKRRVQRRSMRSGQAMLETVLAVLLITAGFVVLYRLNSLLAGKIFMEHAAMRVARARAVGLNEFMCLKAARVAAIPVSGKRLHPDPDDARGEMNEPALARMYMRTPDSSYANGLLRYELWDRLQVIPGHGGASKTALHTDLFNLHGEAEVDDFPVYMRDQGL